LSHDAVAQPHTATCCGYETVLPEKCHLPCGLMQAVFREWPGARGSRRVATIFRKIVLCARIFNMAAAFALAAPSPFPPTESNRWQSAKTRPAGPCRPRRSAHPEVMAIVRSGPPRSCSAPPPSPSRTKSRARRSPCGLMKNGRPNSLRSPRGARTILQDLVGEILQARLDAPNYIRR